VSEKIAMRKERERGDAGQVKIDVSVVQAVEENGDRAAE